MKTYEFFLLVSGLILFNLTTLNAQSRKEIIESLTNKSDSLNKLLKDKNEALQKAEIQLARMEGAAEANRLFFKQYENRTDSLSKALSNKDSLINNLNSELTKLKAAFYESEKSRKQLSSENDTLKAELNTYKQNIPPVSPAKKEAKSDAEPANNTVAKEKPKAQPAKPAETE
jgi:chromosome segregation ATPase